MNTIVITNIHRKPLILPYIQDYRPIVMKVPDWPYPAIGHYRCFHGHTEALKAYMTHQAALVFEDDAIPDESCDWRGVIESARDLIEFDQFEVVCLHGRGFDFEKFDKINKFGFDWLIPNTQDRWVLGTLCYIISDEAAQRWIKNDFWLHGTNIDIFLWSNRFNFCMIDPRQFVDMRTTTETLVAEAPRPFIHGCGAEQSVLQNPRNTEFVIR